MKLYVIHSSEMGGLFLLFLKSCKFQLGILILAGQDHIHLTITDPQLPDFQTVDPKSMVKVHQPKITTDPLDPTDPKVLK